MRQRGVQATRPEQHFMPVEADRHRGAETRVSLHV